MLLLITTQNIIPVIANTVLLLCGQWGGHPTETNWRCGVVSFVTTLAGIPPEKPTAKTAGALCQRCVFCKSKECRAACYVFTVENTQSYDTSCFSVKVRATTLVNITVLDLGMGLGLSKPKAIFVYTVTQILKYKNRF